MTPRLTGAVAGLLNGLIGLGGGIVIVPAMLARGAAPATAVGTALVAVVLFSSVGLLVHGSLGGLVLAPVPALVLLLCGVAGSLLGARLLARLSVPRMLALFALLMFLVSLRLLLQGLGIGAPGALWPGPPDIAGLTLLGAVCGVLSGLLGVGGGALVLLGLATLYGVSVQDGLPLALAANVTNALYGAVHHTRAGRVHGAEVRALLPAAVVGIVVGALLARALPADALRVAFGAFFCGNSLHLARKAWHAR